MRDKSTLPGIRRTKLFELKDANMKFCDYIHHFKNKEEIENHTKLSLIIMGDAVFVKR